MGELVLEVVFQAIMNCVLAKKKQFMSVRTTNGRVTTTSWQMTLSLNNTI